MAAAPKVQIDPQAAQFQPAVAPAPAAPAAPTVWQAQPAPQAGGGAPSLESDFERTIRLIEEANQNRAGQP